MHRNFSTPWPPRGRYEGSKIFLPPSPLKILSSNPLKTVSLCPTLCPLQTVIENLVKILGPVFWLAYFLSLSCISWHICTNPRNGVNYSWYSSRNRQFLKTAPCLACMFYWHRHQGSLTSRFFNAMLNAARSDINSIEMLQLSPTVKTKLCSLHVLNDRTYTRNIADLVLIAISKNQQHVKAIAANSKSTMRTPKPSSYVDHWYRTICYRH